MAWIRHTVKSNPLLILLLALPLALMAEVLHWGYIPIFVISAIGVIPLAGLIGTATEALSIYTGPRIGGLLNATLGNAAELIITLVAIRAGLLELVKASITGSIIGNLLLVLGFAMVFGGVKHGVQKFDRRHAGNHAILLGLTVLALVVPSVFSQSINQAGANRVEELSLGVAAIMIILYVFGLIYSLRSASSPLTITIPEEPVEKSQSRLSVRSAITLLAAATIGVVWLSELLVGAVEPVVKGIGLSEFFIGIILIPIVGNAAEHVVSVQMASKNIMDLSVEIAISSSIQVALFIAPLLIFVSLLLGHPLTIIFNPFELVALIAAVLITVMVSADGESNWLEGAALIGVYLILGISFFLLPA